MDEFEQSDLEKPTGDSHNIIYQNTIHYKERENTFIKKISVNCLLSALMTTRRSNRRRTKAAIRRCDLSPQFFCIDATLLCEFESDKIWIYEFE